MPEPIRILIADDHAVVRDGLAAVLEFQADMTVVGHAKNGREAVERFRELKPDVALMDLAMPELDGSGAIMAIRGEFPDARILVLTTYSGDESVFRALENGAKGYLLKDCSTADLLARSAQFIPAVRTSPLPPERDWPNVRWVARPSPRAKSRC